MYKAMIAIAVASVVVLAGCATQPSGAGASSNVPPAYGGHAPTPPVPEQPGYNRWGTRAPA